MQFFVCKVCITGWPSSLKMCGLVFLVVFFLKNSFYLTMNIAYIAILTARGGEYYTLASVGSWSHSSNTDGGCFEHCSEGSWAVACTLRGGSSSETRSSFRMGKNTETWKQTWLSSMLFQYCVCPTIQYCLSMTIFLVFLKYTVYFRQVEKRKC